MKGGIGLSRVPDEELRRLLSWVHSGRLKAPFTRAQMLASGMPYLSESGDVLFGLDEAGVRVAIVCALAERRHKKAAQPESE